MCSGQRINDNFLRALAESMGRLKIPNQIPKHRLANYYQSSDVKKLIVNKLQ